jgi:hypothetical protein
MTIVAEGLFMSSGSIFTITRYLRRCKRSFGLAMPNDLSSANFPSQVALKTYFDLIVNLLFAINPETGRISVSLQIFVIRWFGQKVMGGFDKRASVNYLPSNSVITEYSAISKAA